MALNEYLPSWEWLVRSFLMGDYISLWLIFVWFIAVNFWSKASWWRCWQEQKPGLHRGIESIPGFLRASRPVLHSRGCSAGPSDRELPAAIQCSRRNTTLSYTQNRIARDPLSFRGEICTSVIEPNQAWAHEDGHLSCLLAAELGKEMN